MNRPHDQAFSGLLDQLRFLPETVNDILRWALRLYTIRTLTQNSALYRQHGIEVPAIPGTLNSFPDLQEYLRILHESIPQAKYLFQGELVEGESWRWDDEPTKWEDVLRFWNRIDTKAENLSTLEQRGQDTFQSALNHLTSRSSLAITGTVSATLIAELVSTVSPREIYDPACGVGNQLVACGRKSRQQGVIQPELYGQDINPILLEFASLHCLLLGFTRFHFELGNALLEPGFAQLSVLAKFPVVVIDPPFGRAMFEEQRELSRDQFNQFWSLGLQRDLEWAFVQHGFASLEPQGRLAVLMNAGTLTRGGDELELRKILIEHDWLEAVIALPQGAWFDNNKLQGFVIVLTRNKRPELRQRVAMIDLSKTTVNQKDKSDMAFAAPALQAYRNLTEIPEQVQFVDCRVIESSSYNFQPGHYLKIVTERQPINLEAMRQSVLILKEETDRAGREFDEAILALQMLQN
jgi:hypothetical protein